MEYPEPSVEEWIVRECQEKIKTQKLIRKAIYGGVATVVSAAILYAGIQVTSTILEPQLHESIKSKGEIQQGLPPTTYTNNKSELENSVLSL